MASAGSLTVEAVGQSADVSTMRPEIESTELILSLAADTPIGFLYVAPGSRIGMDELNAPAIGERKGFYQVESNCLGYSYPSPTP